jgi:hypothetical protein
MTVEEQVRHLREHEICRRMQWKAWLEISLRAAGKGVMITVE